LQPIALPWKIGTRQVGYGGWMNTEPIEFHKIWIEQCEATETIRERFGLQNALDYLIGEKLFHFVAAAEQHPEFAAELPHFLNQIRRTFTAQQIHNYLDDLERAKFMSPIEADEDLDLEDEDPEFADYLLDNPILGAQELLRFARVKEMLQAG
jgi:hypothetical protein